MTYARWLHDNQVNEFARLGISFPYLKRPDGTPRLLGAVDFEHSLCYFSRYLSARAEISDGARGLFDSLHEHQERREVKRLSIKTLASAPASFKAACMRASGVAPPEDSEGDDGGKSVRLQ